jgi:hypothetical protein
VSAADDEARWLSEEDSDAVTSPLPAPHLVATPVRATQVYDVEAEGGVGAAGRRMPSPRADEPVDLMTAMRERASHRGRPRRRKGPAAQTPLDEAPRDDALPLEDLDFDPESMPAPPAARGVHPLDAPADASGVQTDPDPEAEADTAADAPTDVPSEAPIEPAIEAAADQPADEPAHEPVDKPTDQPMPSEPSVPSVPRSGAGRALGVGDDVLPAAERPRESATGTDSSPANGLAAAKRPAKRATRRSVPSWDDVMFGAKPQD